jgi:DNA polymerase-3 subunit delta'
MYLNPSENRCLYGMSYFFNEIINLYNKKKMPNKILLSGKKGLGKSTLAYHIINYILSLNEDFKYDIKKFNINKNNKSYKLLQNHSHPNFYLIDLIEEKKTIDVAQIRDMINYTNKSCFNDLPRFILIDNIEKLNKNSNNALLKIIEEPNDGIFFILINNNEKKILPTLKSRCLNYKINLTFIQSIDIANLVLDKCISNLINSDIINYYITPGEIINLVNLSVDKKINLLDHNLESLLKLLIDNGYYKKNKVIKEMIINFIELFFLKKYRLTNTKKTFLNFYHKFLNKIHNMEKFNLDEESLFLEFKSKLLHE